METLVFPDDRHVERSWRFRRRLERPVKEPANPVLTATEPWEALLCAYGSVLHDEGIYRAYYTMWWLDPAPPHACRAEGLCYATSRDGVHWEKPDLGLVPEVNGGRNNLIRYGLFADQPCVLRLAEPRGPLRYAMAYYGDFAPHGPGVRLAFSEDGIRWGFPGELVWRTGLDGVSSALPYYAADDTLSFHHDARRGRYVLLRKVMAEGGLAGAAGFAPDPERLERRIARCESADLVHWEQHRVVLAPDADDPPGHDFHRLRAGPAAGGQLGLLEVHDGRPGEETIALHLAHSEDGERWVRPCRAEQEARPFLARGPDGAWDGGLVFTASGWVEREDEVELFYGGMAARLDAASMARCRRFGIGLARLERDRFVSLTAPPGEPAILVTRPITLGDGLFVNARVRPGGLLQLALHAPSGEPVPGCDFAASRLPGGDLRYARAAWAGGAAPSPGRYRVSVRARDADLFALRAG